MAETKPCSICKTSKPLTEYYFRVDKPRIRRSVCKACTQAARDKWRKENPEKARAEAKRYYHADTTRQRSYRLQSKYGWTLADFTARLVAQGGKCAVCKMAAVKGRWAVDHNHETGRVRDILCDDCNVALGRFRESIPTLRSAIVYLRNHA